MGLGRSVVLSEGQARTDPQDDAKMHAGRQVFEKNCLQCHAIYEGQYSFGPNLFHEMKKPDHKVTAAELRGIIENGKGKMPPFKDKLTPPDVDDLIFYLHSL